MNRFDVVIVGAGTAGQTAAYDLRQQGLQVAVVEQSDRPGGVCALAGCQAKKFFYEVTETVARAHHLKEKGVLAVPKVSWGETLGQKNHFTSRVPENTVNGFREAGIEFIPGPARFENKDTMRVGEQKIRADHYVLATGAKPMTLPLEGAEHITTSDEFLDRENLPEKILFLGGGFISFEFAHFAARMGPTNRQILILEVGDRPLGPFDEEMVGILMAASEEEGIEIHTRTTVEKIENHNGRLIAQTLNHRFDVDLIVHGAGRQANIGQLDLMAAQIEFSPRGILVDSQMRTTNPRVYAIGDCAATIQLARVADFEGHVAAKNILADRGKGHRATVDYSAVPSLLFTYPQYGMIGKTEDAIKKEGRPYHKSFGKNLRWPTYRRIGMKHAAYKILAGENGEFLGAHFISDNASGLINSIRQAMIQGVTAEDLYQSSIMTPYPSRESDLLYMLQPLLP